MKPPNLKFHEEEDDVHQRYEHVHHQCQDDHELENVTLDSEQSVLSEEHHTKQDRSRVTASRPGALNIYLDLVTTPTNHQ